MPDHEELLTRDELIVMIMEENKLTRELAERLVEKMIAEFPEAIVKVEQH